MLDWVYVAMFSCSLLTRGPVPVLVDAARCAYLLRGASPEARATMLLGVPLGVMAVDGSATRRLLAMNVLVLALNWFAPVPMWHVHAMEGVILTTSVYGVFRHGLYQHGVFREGVFQLCVFRHGLLDRGTSLFRTGARYFFDR